MLKMVLRNSSLYPKLLCLFCLLWLLSANADRTGYVTDFRSMIELLQELKKAVVHIEACKHLIMPQQGKRKLKVCWTSMHNKKSEVSCLL